MISGNCFDGAKPPTTKVLVYVPVFLNPQPSMCSGETHAVTSTTELRNQTNRAQSSALAELGWGLAVHTSVDCSTQNLSVNLVIAEGENHPCCEVSSSRKPL